MSEPGSPIRLFIHIGAPKSASTHLQEMLWANEERLRAAGVFLPGENQRFHFDIGWDIRGKRQKDERPPNYWVGSFERALDEIRVSGCHTAVITDEILSKASRKHVEKVLETTGSFDVHIVYVIRDLAGLLPSFWQTEIRNGRSFDFEEWLDRSSRHISRDTFWQFHDLDDVVRRWAPDGSVPFHAIALPSASDDTLWSRFCQVLGIDIDAEIPSRPANRSLGWSETELLRRVQERMPNARHARAVMNHFVSRKLLAERSSPNPILIPDAHRQWIARENAARVDCFERLPSRVGCAADLAMSDDRFGTPDQSDDIEQQLEAAIDVIVGMAKRLAKVRAVAAETEAPVRGTKMRLVLSGLRERLFPFGVESLRGRRR